MVKTQLNIVIDRININQVSKTKFLGLYIDESLIWVNYITHISSKISKNIGVIKRLSKIVQHHILNTLNNTLITPYLQKRIIRIICNAERLASTSSLFKQRNLLKLHDITFFRLHNLCINTIIVCCLQYSMTILY